MDRNGWLDRNRRSMEDVFAAFSRASPDLLVKIDGVFAVISPETPERSVFNSVVFANAGALADAYEQLAAAYAEHGCAWTVWVPEDDAEAISLLEAAGHRLDAAPRCMGLELAALAEPDVPEVEITAGRDLPAMGVLNDLGYGDPEGTFLRGVGADADLIVYLAHIDREPVATVASHDVDDDCSIWCVATDPEARGKGLSTALMLRALRDARERGCATSTLQATQLGAPVYERVGYGDFGALQMWERRPPTPA
jgi:GNAT superfamily N-acetyltransferase